MSWNWFTFWRPRKKSPEQGVDVPHSEGNIVMYTRQGCHLCEKAWQQLEEAQTRYGFHLRQVDIDGDPQLVRDYGECVPVVTIDGKVRFRGAVNRVLLKRLLSR